MSSAAQYIPAYHNGVAVRFSGRGLVRPGTPERTQRPRAPPGGRAGRGVLPCRGIVGVSRRAACSASCSASLLARPRSSAGRPGGQDSVFISQLYSTRTRSRTAESCGRTAVRYSHGTSNTVTEQLTNSTLHGCRAARQTDGLHGEWTPWPWRARSSPNMRSVRLIAGEGGGRCRRALERKLPATPRAMPMPRTLRACVGETGLDRASPSSGSDGKRRAFGGAP